MTEPDRVIQPQPQQGDERDRALRPQALEEFVGQAEARANLRVFIESARARGEPMDHTLFYGPPASARRRWRRSSPASSA